jgi:hypothetical protein
MRRKPLWEGITMRIRFTSGILSLAVILAIATPMVLFAKATLVTLRELTQESQLVVDGHVEGSSIGSASSESSNWLRFGVTDALKGASLVREGAVSLCNSRPNTEWPDLSKLTGRAVLFLLHSQKKDCFNLSHNYRSLIKISGDEVDTLVIEGEPARQPVDAFLQKVRSLVSSGK